MSRSTKPNVMVSSTVNDLAEVRDQITSAVKDDLGYNVFVSEHYDFPVIDGDKGPLVVKEFVDVLILIIGKRYGSVDEATGLSVTHLEYHEARDKPVPILAFVDETLLTLMPDWRDNPTRQFRNIPNNLVFNFVDEVNKDGNWRYPYNLSEDIIKGIKERFAQLMKTHLSDAARIATAESSIPEVQRLVHILDDCDGYHNWRFRINWPHADVQTDMRVDAYSNEINWGQLLGALLSCPDSVGKRDVASVFSALEKVVTKGGPPPRKLSATILFSGTSEAALDHAQRFLGSHPYERPKVRDTKPKAEIPESPEELLISREFMGHPTVFDDYQSAQKRIALTASAICKYVLCSTYQVSISQGFRLKITPRGRARLAVACTAANTNKEILGAVADIPVLTQKQNGDIVWYGQPGRRPTSEHASHWEYHQTAFRNKWTTNLIIHFHPVGLLELWNKLRSRPDPKSRSSAWTKAQAIAKREGYSLCVFRKHESISARDTSFGRFLADAVGKSLKVKSPVALVWKPNHGVWLMCDSSVDEASMQQMLLSVEGLCDHLASELGIE